MEFPQPLLENISQYLIGQHETISVAEGVTSGFLQLAFSQMPESEQFFKGGITVYKPQDKTKHLDIDEDFVKVKASKTLTDEMALAVTRKFDTDWGVAATGYASASLESGGNVFAHYSIAHQGRIVLSDQIELHPLTKSLDAKNYFTECVLSCLRREFNQQLMPLAVAY